MLNHDAGLREDTDRERHLAAGDYVIIDYRGYEVFSTPTFTVALDKMLQRKRDGYGPDMLQNLARVTSDESGYGITDDEAAMMEEAGI
jgi:hypothetical protein